MNESSIKEISDDALFNIATEAWSTQTDTSWSTDGLEAAVLAVRSAVEDAPLRASAPQENGRTLHKPVGTYTDEEAENSVADAYAALSAPPSVALEAPYRWNTESNARDEVKVRSYIDNLRFAIASEIEAKCNAQTDDYYTIGCSVLEIPIVESLVKFALAALTRPQPGGAVAGTERGSP